MTNLTLTAHKFNIVARYDIPLLLELITWKVLNTTNNAFTQTIQ